MYEDKQNQPRVLIVSTIYFYDSVRLFNVYFNSKYDDDVPNDEDINFVANKLTDNLYNTTVLFTDCNKLIANETIKYNWILVNDDNIQPSQMIDYRYVDDSLRSAHVDRPTMFIRSKSNVANTFRCIVS